MRIAEEEERERNAESITDDGRQKNEKIKERKKARRFVPDCVHKHKRENMCVSERAHALLFNKQRVREQARERESQGKSQRKDRQTERKNEMVREWERGERERPTDRGRQTDRQTDRQREHGGSCVFSGVEGSAVAPALGHTLQLLPLATQQTARLDIAFNNI